MAIVSFILPIVSFFLLTTSTISQSSYNLIPLGSSLSSTTAPSSWSSQSGNFSFGFTSDLSGNLYAGIWFVKISGSNSLVWTANRDNPAPKGSVIELTTGGKLLLKDETGYQLSEIASSATGGVGYAAVLDNGNLVLLSSDQTQFKWQSFDHPTDTIVSGQIVPGAKTPQLISSFLSTSISSGRFFLWMISNGNLAIDLIRKPEDFLWVYETNTTGSGKQLVFNDTSGLIYVSLKNGSVFSLTPENAIPAPANDYYHKATLEYDGIFRQYVYPKNNNNASWTKVWSTMDNPCEVATLCGLNGYCVNSGSSNEAFDCFCPQNFSFFDPNYKFFGCKPDFPIDDCRSKPEDHELVAYPDIDWRGNDYDLLRSVELGNCTAACLSDCLCTAASYRHDLQRCWFKKLPLTRGKKQAVDPVVKVTEFIKVPKNSPWSEKTCKNSAKLQKILLVLSWAIIGALLFVNVCLVVDFCNRRRYCRLARTSPRRVQHEDSSAAGNLRNFSYDELRDATNGFSDEIGRGSFGSVYKGMLKSFVGEKPIAVKKLDKLVEDGEREFRAELSVIGRTHHKNLVELIGFCDQGSNRLLVYEYMENGSLSSFVHNVDSSRLKWDQRVQIALEIAKGLVYLHEECSTQILHCDIKPGNILLDREFAPKIADFGLAKLLRLDQTRTLTDIRGTRGYVAPEWFTKMAVTTKVDVYSFGVMLLEIICCRKNFDAQKINDPSAVLVDWAYDCFVGNRLDLLVVKDEEAGGDRMAFVKMVMIALWCIQRNPVQRPNMKKVVQMIEGTVMVEDPPMNSTSF